MTRSTLFILSHQFYSFFPFVRSLARSFFHSWWVFLMSPPVWFDVRIHHTHQKFCNLFVCRRSVERLPKVNVNARTDKTSNRLIITTHRLHVYKSSHINDRKLLVYHTIESDIETHWTHHEIEIFKSFMRLHARPFHTNLLANSVPPFVYLSVSSS